MNAASSYALTPRHPNARTKPSQSTKVVSLSADGRGRALCFSFSCQKPTLQQMTRWERPQPGVHTATTLFQVAPQWEPAACHERACPGERRRLSRKENVKSQGTQPSAPAPRDSRARSCGTRAAPWPRCSADLRAARPSSAALRCIGEAKYFYYLFYSLLYELLLFTWRFCLLLQVWNYLLLLGTCALLEKRALFFLNCG